MSRSGYSDSCEGWALIRWRGAVNAAIRGKRGQSALQELAQALDALPEKRLAANSLVTAEGEYCTLGALGRARGMDMAAIDADDRGAVAGAFGIAEALAAEIMYMNDENPFFYGTTPEAAERRWQYMRKWVADQLKEPATNPSTQQGGQ